MNNEEFGSIRRRMGKTQKQMAQLLGISLKAVQSFEQGWRRVPAHVERQVLYLLAFRRGEAKRPPCWEQLSCSPGRRENCPAWEFQHGELCWFINGTICQGEAHSNWQRKMKICRECPVFVRLLAGETQVSTADSG